MPSLRVVLLAIISCPLLGAAELTVNIECDDGLIVSLIAVDQQPEKSFRSTNPESEQDDGVFKWKALGPGRHHLYLEPNEENYLGENISTIYLDIKEGSNSFDAIIPDSSVAFKLIIRPSGSIWDSDDRRGWETLRIDRFDEFGKVDPYFVRWLWIWHGEPLPDSSTRDGDSRSLDWMSAGRYRISQFGTNPYSDNEAYANVRVTTAHLKGKPLTFSLKLFPTSNLIPTLTAGSLFALAGLSAFKLFVASPWDR